MRTINRASDVLTLNHETKAMGIWGDLFSIVGIIGTVISVLGVFLCLLSEDKSDIYIGLSVLLSSHPFYNDIQFLFNKNVQI